MLEHLGYEAVYERRLTRVTCTVWSVPRDDQGSRQRRGQGEGIASRRQLLQKMGELIPNLKSRKEGKAPKPGVPGMALPGYPETLMPIKADELPPQLASSGAAGAGGGGGSNKKGKDKKK